MAARKTKSVSFDAMVKFFMRQYNIPTRRDIDLLLTRLDRIETLLKGGSRAPVRRIVASSGSAPKSGSRRQVLTATDMVFDVIQRAPKGLGFKGIQAATGFDDKKIRNIIYRLDKTKKIKRKTRGIYTAK